MNGTIRVHPRDNVEVVLTAGQAAPLGHKLALTDIPAGGDVIKYGFPIGKAIADIKAGEHVHSHNLKTGLSGLLAYAYEPELPAAARKTPRMFMGFKRAHGVGVRNEIWIIPTVGCVNSVAEIIAKRAQEKIRGGIEGIYAFPHPYGCSQIGGDLEYTKKALCGLVKHPNAGGALVLGLGCEYNGMAGMREMLGNIDERRIKFLVSQEHTDEVAAALELIEQLVSVVGRDAREPAPASELIIGLKCGGSDGLSGITANPLLGAFSDRLIAEGGSAILTEVPEMFGAETILMKRCVNERVFQKTVSLINDFKAYFMAYGQPIYENPSPGNKEGGITTLEEKSLGCTQKAGTAAVTDVLSYGERLHEKGLNLLQSPGNDLVASTALAASGAQIVLFTTGRGTPFGSPAPTVKISTNTPLYEKKPGWIDFNAGALVTGESLENMAEDFYEYILRVVSGAERTKAEENGMRELAIFKDGVTM